MKKLKAEQKSFIRNIIVVIIALIVIERIVDIAPGYKREKQSNYTKLIINENETVENLKNPIYINENEAVYMSIEDIKNYFDNTIYYDEESEEIITTDTTKVANLKINKNVMTVNEANIEIFNTAIDKNSTIYLPISEMKLVYNIDVKYVKETNTVIIDDLSKGMIVANLLDETSVKYKQRALSKDVEKLEAGTKVYCFYTTSKGWRKIRTERGILGYIKANKLTNEYIIRQDMEVIEKAEELKNIKEKEVFVVNDKETIITSIKDQNIEELKSKYDVWIVFSNKNTEDELNTILSNYYERTNFINDLLEILVSNKIHGVSIKISETDNTENFKRFIIELSPKLREAGIKTSIKLNKKVSKEEFNQYVDYIIEE